MIKELKYFDASDNSATSDVKHLGVLLVNDLSTRTDFMFGPWGLLTLRPKSLETLNFLNEVLSGRDLNSSYGNEILEELTTIISQKLKNLGPDTFFYVVNYDDSIEENFKLRFSKNANLSLIAPVHINFTRTGLKFGLITDSINVLFDRLEKSKLGLSCFELVFGTSIEVPATCAYPKEKVFEESLIFANLATSKRI